jgi:hypothetical protein
MKQFVIILSIFSLMCLTGCSKPIGDIYGGGGGGGRISDADLMWLVPRRQLYQIDERFLRNEDFQIFIADKGHIMEIPASTSGVRVIISGDHNLTTEFRELVNTTHHQFFRVGRHVITVDFDDKSANYSLEVFSPSDGAGIGGDDGIGIIWLD